MPATQIRKARSEPHLQAPRRLLKLLTLRQRCDDMLMFSVVATALLMSMALLPAYGATAPRMTSAKADRIPSQALIRACSADAWGSESPECLAAIARESGREAASSIRIIATLPDKTRPNVF